MAGEQPPHDQVFPEYILSAATPRQDLPEPILTPGPGGQPMLAQLIPKDVWKAEHQREMETYQAGKTVQHHSQKNHEQASLFRSQPFDDLADRDDYSIYRPVKPNYLVNYESACRNGVISTVQSVISSETRTPNFLRHGLVIAVRAGNAEVASYLLSAGAQIDRGTPADILLAPVDKQLPLFELFSQYGWTPNSPGYYGSVLLPSIVTNMPLLRWFLDHGADPNLGQQRYFQDRLGEPETQRAAALEAASSKADIEAVRMLLDAGAKISYGVPLHFAAGACPPDTNPHAGRVVPSKEFDTDRIPIMELLVQRGADVNQPEESRYMVPRYAIVHAVMAGAVERVKWLLEHGADPNLRGANGSAVQYAKICGSDEMREVIDEGIAARINTL